MVARIQRKQLKGKVIGLQARKGEQKSDEHRMVGASGKADPVSYPYPVLPSLSPNEILGDLDLIFVARQTTHDFSSKPPIGINAPNQATYEPTDSLSHTVGPSHQQAGTTYHSANSGPNQAGHIVPAPPNSAFILPTTQPVGSRAYPHHHFSPFDDEFLPG